MNTAVVSFNTTMRHDRNVSMSKMSQQKKQVASTFIYWECP